MPRAFIISFTIATMDLVSQTIPSIRVFFVLSDIIAFQQWLAKEHSTVDIDELLKGYTFTMQCCLNCFINGIENDYTLGLQEDFLFQRASSESIYLHKIDSSCEKTIFLKNLKPLIKAILKSESYSKLQTNAMNFHDAVGQYILQIANKHLRIKPHLKLDRKEADYLVMIDYIHTYLFQIHSNGPTANFLNVLSPDRPSQSRLKEYLHGYKYAVQFLLWKVLGEQAYRNTSFTKLHTATSWKDYVFDGAPRSDDFADLLALESSFDLQKQNSVDSYFYRITNEITTKLEKKYTFPIYTIDSHYTFYDTGYDRQNFFGHLLISKADEDVFSKLSWEDKVLTKLYWYPFTVIKSDESDLTLGITSFSTALAGTVTLHTKECSSDKVVVARFRHPGTKGKYGSDYSYGVLLESQPSAGHYNNGWIIYQDACGDYSGFSKREYRTAESIIKEYLTAGKIDLREMDIPLAQFKKITASYTETQLEENTITRNLQSSDIMQKARAYVFELFIYYLHVSYHRNNFTILFNTDQKSEEGEKDVLLESDTHVIIIECKLNCNSYDVNEIIEKMEKKQSKYHHKIATSELWLWKEPSTQNDSLLRKNNIKTVVVSQGGPSPLLKGIALERLKFIMKDY